MEERIMRKKRCQDCNRFRCICPEKQEDDEHNVNLVDLFNAQPILGLKRMMPIGS